MCEPCEDSSTAGLLVLVVIIGGGLITVTLYDDMLAPKLMTTPWLWRYIVLLGAMKDTCFEPIRILISFAQVFTQLGLVLQITFVRSLIAGSSMVSQC